MNPSQFYSLLKKKTMYIVGLKIVNDQKWPRLTNVIIFFILMRAIQSVDCVSLLTGSYSSVVTKYLKESQLYKFYHQLFYRLLRFENGDDVLII